MTFPNFRGRRLRQNNCLRKMVCETKLSPSDFVLPIFSIFGKNVKNPIPSMPGHFQLSVDNIVSYAKNAFKLDIPAIILFGIPENKDSIGKDAFLNDGVVQNAVKAIKDAVPDLVVITDICLCQYTDHGHCGIVENGIIENDKTCEILAKVALSHVEAGADMVAPSDMMDGRVFQIRQFLDEHGFYNTPIMSYASKYCSAFYGPFRQAADSAPQFGDRRTYQMDPANANEAVREAIADVNEGADIIMIKPALSYLDVIYRIKQEINLPLAAYNVSGEFSMIKAAEKMGWLDGKRTMLEMLLSIKRAGADIILTYFAIEAAEILQNGK